jgi:hypothetical protein
MADTETPILSKLRDCIGEEHFHEEVRNGKTLTILNDVGVIFDKLQALAVTEGIEYSWKEKSSGRYPHNGVAFFVGELTISLYTGTSYTMVGTAEGQSAEMGLSGVATLALSNAALRGFGMAAWAYEKEDAGEAQEYSAPLPTSPFSSATSAPSSSNGTRSPTQATRNDGKPFPPWDGTVKLKGTSQWAGQMYKDLPIEVLQKWASFSDPNPNAVREINRRMSIGGSLPQVASAFSN